LHICKNYWTNNEKSKHRRSDNYQMHIFI